MLKNNFKLPIKKIKPFIILGFKLIWIGQIVKSKIEVRIMILTMYLYAVKFFCFESFPRHNILADPSLDFDADRLSEWNKICYRWLLAKSAAIATCVHIFDLYKDDE